MLGRPQAGIAWLLTFVLAAGVAAKGKDREPELSESHQRWLETVELLIEDDERDAFLELADDDERDRFIEAFWRRRDPHPETARNELREEWTYRATLARQSFGDLGDPRSRFVFENGWPDERYRVHCRNVLNHEVWLYRASAELRQDVPVILYPMAWEWRVWDPWDSERMFYDEDGGKPRRPPRNCNYEVFQDAVSRIRELNEPRGSYAELVARLGATGLRRFREERFEADPTALPEGAETFRANVRFAFAGRRQSRTLVDGLVVVPRAEVEALDLGGVRSYNLDLDGKVLSHDAVFETFRYRFDLPARQTAGDVLPLAFRRALRPGDYEIVIRVEDRASGRFFRHHRGLTVPRSAEPADAPPRATAPPGRLEIMEEPAEKRTDMMRFRFRSGDPAIDRVEFALDDRPVFTKRRPPFSVELDLGELPEPRLLRATALDADGAVVASDTLLVNPDPHAFGVRLVEPVHGHSYRGSVRVRARVAVPADRRLERLELFRDDERVATLDGGPFEHTLELTAEMTLIRAVAVLVDSTTAEDAVIVNSPDPGDEIDVDLVELYVGVTDRGGGTVDDVEAAAFTVYENGRRQEILRCERARDLPIRATLLVDMSASMAGRLDAVRQAALGLFDAMTGADDRVALVTFSDRPAVKTGFTRDFERFAEGLAALRAEGGTALYDSLVFALYYGEALKGQRAVLLLTDGVDEDSRYGADEVFEALRRQGVAVYAVGFDLPRRGGGRKTLNRLAEESGGRAFFIDAAAELAGVYSTIRAELGAKYLLVYQSDGSQEDGFRRIEVAVDRPGVEARTIRGYSLEVR